MKDVVMVWLVELVAIALCAAFWGPVTFMFALVGFWTSLACTALELQAHAHIRKRRALDLIERAAKRA